MISIWREFHEISNQFKWFLKQYFQYSMTLSKNMLNLITIFTFTISWIKHWIILNQQCNCFYDNLLIKRKEWFGALNNFNCESYNTMMYIYDDQPFTPKKEITDGRIFLYIFYGKYDKVYSSKSILRVRRMLSKMISVIVSSKNGTYVRLHC